MEFKLTIGITPELDAQLKEFMAAFAKPKPEDLKAILDKFNEAAKRVEGLKAEQHQHDELQGQDGPKKSTTEASAEAPAAEMTSWQKRKAAMAKAAEKKATKTELTDTDEGQDLTPEPVTDGKIDIALLQEISRRKAQAGMAKQIKALLTEAGVEKLTALEDHQIADFYTKLQEL